eukprot:SAG31_NODE_6457_length_2002_cov_0.821130_4_plen_259_part_00
MREKAVEALCTVGAAVPPEHVGEYFLEMLKRLSSGDWFTSRVSSCGLFATAYSRVTPAENAGGTGGVASQSAVRAQLRASFKQLCEDDTPMVRRAAAASLGKFAAEVESDLLVSDIVPMCSHLAVDDQDSVRILVVQNCAALAKLLPGTDAQDTYVVPMVKKFAEDKSWRVRYMVAEQLCGLAKVLSPSTTQRDLGPIFASMMKDDEAEVRTVAAHHIPAFCGCLPAAQVQTQVLDSLGSLADDPSQHVKAALAQELM